MQTYICKCGKTFEKSTNAETTGYVLDDYSPEHECYGCPYIVNDRDWKTNEIIKRECRATPKITYLTRCKIGTDSGDFSACRLYSLDLTFVKRVMNYVNSLDGVESTEFGNRVPDEWRAADFGQCYSFDDCFGLAIFPLEFKKNKKGTQARRMVKERFFYEDGRRINMTEDEEREIILTRIEIAKENAGNKTIKKIVEEEKNMKFDINNMIGGSQQTAQTAQTSEIPLDMLVPYHNHKFTLYEGERLEDMVRSIAKNGVLVPIIVADANGGKYEILAGHNRVRAAREAGLTTIPAIIKNGLTSDEAEMYVIETNLMQRGFGDLKLSERAAVIALRHSKLFDEKKRKEISEELQAMEGFSESNNEDVKKTSKLAEAGEEYGLGKTTVARLIRLNKLLEKRPEFTASVNEEILSLRAAAELSYIEENILSVIFEKYKSSIVINNIWESVVKIDEKTAKELRGIFECFAGTKEQTELAVEQFRTGMADPSEKPPKPIKVIFQPDIFRKYFTENTSAEEISDTIDKALEMYFSAKK